MIEEHRQARIKATLLILNTISTQISFSPPNPPVSTSEQQTYSKDAKARDMLPGIGRWLPYTFKLTIHLFNLLDLYTILSSLYPELALPTRIHRVLIPKSNSASLELTFPLVAGSMLIYAATLLRVTCYRMLGQYFTYELAILKEHKLVTTGPYDWVRHPSYSAIILFMIGIAFTHLGGGSWWVECGLEGTALGRIMLAAWTVTTFGGVALSVSRVKKEDKILRDEFKGEWEAWRERTPYALIPFCY